MACRSDAGEVKAAERTRLESGVPASYDNHLCHARWGKKKKRRAERQGAALPARSTCTKLREMR